MRLWHKDLIEVLPRKQLLAQWRECCCIAKNIADNGTPNHLLVNRVLDYSVVEFTRYTNLILKEMHNRGYKVSESAFVRFVANCNKAQKYFNNSYSLTPNYPLFEGWHDDRYFLQCYHNLQEKFDCYGMNHDEWHKIRDLKLSQYK